MNPKEVAAEMVRSFRAHHPGRYTIKKWKSPHHESIFWVSIEAKAYDPKYQRIVENSKANHFPTEAEATQAFNALAAMNN